MSLFGPSISRRGLWLVGGGCAQPSKSKAGICLGFQNCSRTGCLNNRRPRLQPARASNGEPPQEPSPRDRELRTLLALLVRYPGLYGTAAVLLGYTLHIPATGNWHWDAGDALTGLTLALPLALLDTALMLPSYAPATKLKHIKIKVPRAVAEKLKEKEAAENQSSASEGANGSGDSSSSSSPATLPPERQRDGNGASGSVESSGSSGSRVPAAGPAGLAAAAALGTASGMASGTSIEGGGEGGEDVVEVEHAFPVGVEQPPLLAALYRLQMEKTATNAALGLSVPSELALVLTHHLASEMLWRAVVLAGVTTWCTDLLYLAGLDDVLYRQGGAWQAATPQVGVALAVTLVAVAAVGVVVQREMYPLRLVEMLEKAAKKGRRRRGGQRGQEQAEAPEPSQAGRQQQEPAQAPAGERQQEGEGGVGEEGNGADSSQRLTAMLSKMKKRMTAQQRWTMGVEGVRVGTESVCYSLAFLLTGNLLSSYVAALANDLLFSIYQRVRQAEAQREQRSTLERLTKISATMAQLRGAKVARLQPKKSPPDAGSGNGGGGSSGPSSDNESKR